MPLADTPAYVARLPLLLFLLVSTGTYASSAVTTPSSSSSAPTRFCASPTNETCGVALSKPLRPRDLPALRLFDVFASNETMRLSGSAGGVVAQPVARGEMPQLGYTDDVSVFTLAPGLVPRDTVAAMLAVLTDEDLGELDGDPDTVDAMPTREIYIDNVELRASGISKANQEPMAQAISRRPMREALKKLTQPILDERITPLVRQLFPEACGRGDGRACTPCWSLVRRYKHGERNTHGTHRDGHALVTVVMSLSDYGEEYRGGLYVSTDNSQRKFMQLRRGDGVVHQGDLLHGVKVRRKEPCVCVLYCVSVYVCVCGVVRLWCAVYVFEVYACRTPLCRPWCAACVSVYVYVYVYVGVVRLWCAVYGV